MVHSLHSLHVRHPFVFLHPVPPLSEGPRDLSLSLGRKDMQELARLQDDRVPVGPVLLDVPGPAEINGTLKGGFAMRVEHGNDLVLNSPILEFKPTCLFIR